MAKLEMIVDDLDNSEDAQTRQFMGPDGVLREIDLTDQNAEALEEALAPFIAVSRPAGRKLHQKPHTASVSLDPEEEETIREWAAEYTPQELRDMARTAGARGVPDRGRVPLACLKVAYDAEHKRARKTRKTRAYGLPVH